MFGKLRKWMFQSRWAVDISEAPPYFKNWIFQSLPYRIYEQPGKAELFKKIARWRNDNYKEEWDPVRVVHFMRLLEQVASLPEGDYIEVGTQYGGTAKFIWDLMTPDCSLYCLCTFAGCPYDGLDDQR